MDEFDRKLFEYADTFGENFPTFLYRGSTPAQVIAIIDDCLKRGKPLKAEYDRDADI